VMGNVKTTTAIVSAARKIRCNILSSSRVWTSCIADGLANQRSPFP
jgi:hypothetical protein